MLRYTIVLLPLAVTLFIDLPTLNAHQDNDAKQNSVVLKDEASGSMMESLMNDDQVAYKKELSHISRQKRGKGCKPKGKCKKKEGKCSQTQTCQLSEKLIKRGCKGGKKCKCCAPKTPKPSKPKCEALSLCSSVGGSCVQKKKKCKSGFILDGVCTGKKCFCCIPVSDECVDQLANWTPPTDLELPDIDTIISLNCISYLELLGCLIDFTPCITKVVEECASELIDLLLPEDAPKECIEELINQIDIEELLSEIDITTLTDNLSEQIQSRKGQPGYEGDGQNITQLPSLLNN